MRSSSAPQVAPIDLDLLTLHFYLVCHLRASVPGRLLEEWPRVDSELRGLLGHRRPPLRRLFQHDPLRVSIAPNPAFLAPNPTCRAQSKPHPAVV